MPSQPQLALPSSRRTQVFRAIVQVLMADPVLKRVVRVWKSWEGNPDDGADITQGQLPAIRLTPAGDQPGETQRYEDADVGAFTIVVELVTPGFCMDDPLNLWSALERAFYPVDPAASTAIIVRFQQLSGGGDGMLRFGRPAVAPVDPDQGIMAARGMISFDVLTSI